MKNTLIGLLVVAMLAMAMSLAVAAENAAPKKDAPPPLTTLNGAVKDLTVPADARYAVSFILVTDAASVKVELGPMPCLTKLGLALKDGDKVAVTGWQRTTPNGAMMLACSVTPDGGKAVTLRDENRVGVWVVKSEPIKLDGTVKSLSKEKAMASVTVTSDAGEMKVTLAPAKYLEFIGLALKEGDKVSISGWKLSAFDESVVKVGEITLNGKTYTLRDEKQHAAWEPVSQLVTLKRAVKNLSLPDAVAPKHKDITFVLTGDNDLSVYTILGPPEEIQKLGLTLKDGDAVSITGKQSTTFDKKVSLLAQTITANGTTYTLRDANDRPVWAAPKPTTPATTPPPAK